MVVCRQLSRHLLICVALGLVFITAFVGMHRKWTAVKNSSEYSIVEGVPAHLSQELAHPAVVTDAQPTVNTSEFYCADMEAPVFLQPGQLPLTALHSFPGSGNTWLRILLSSLTGWNTGSIYHDDSFDDIPGFTYCKNDTVIVVKTHYPFFSKEVYHRDWKRAIILVRHPLDATLSVFNFDQMNYSHTKVAPLNKYLLENGTLTRYWSTFAHYHIKRWLLCMEYWVSIYNGPKLIIFYEDLKKNLVEQLMVINKFLGLELDERRLNCTLNSNAQQRFHRKQEVDKRLLYDASMLNEAEVVLQQVNEMLTQNHMHTRFPDSYSVNQLHKNFAVKSSIKQSPSG